MILEQKEFSKKLSCTMGEISIKWGEKLNSSSTVRNVKHVEENSSSFVEIRDLEFQRSTIADLEFLMIMQNIEVFWISTKDVAILWTEKKFSKINMSQYCWRSWFSIKDGEFYSNIWHYGHLNYPSCTTISLKILFVQES